MDRQDDENEGFLTEEEIASRWRGKVSQGTLRNWRTQGRGPPYLKVGRSILYPRRQLEAWEDEHMSGAAAG